MQPVLFVVPVLAALAIWFVLREGLRQEKDRRRLQAPRTAKGDGKGGLPLLGFAQVLQHVGIIHPLRPAGEGNAKLRERRVPLQPARLNENVNFRLSHQIYKLMIAQVGYWMPTIT